MSVLEKLTPLIVERLGVEEKDVTLEATFKGDLGADSLDVVELIMELEDAFDLEITDEEGETLTTVGAVVEFIEEKSK